VARLGRWAIGQMFMSYLTQIPLEVLLVQAGFLSDKGAYNLVRSSVPVPECLRKMSFPWVEEKLKVVKEVIFFLKYHIVVLFY
jgi:hypothetical protein